MANFSDVTTMNKVASTLKTNLDKILNKHMAVLDTTKIVDHAFALYMSYHISQTYGSL